MRYLIHLNKRKKKKKKRKKVYSFIACEIWFVDTKGLIKFSYEIAIVISFLFCLSLSLSFCLTIIACRVQKTFSSTQFLI